MKPTNQRVYKRIRECWDAMAPMVRRGYRVTVVMVGAHFAEEWGMTGPVFPSGLPRFVPCIYIPARAMLLIGEGPETAWRAGHIQGGMWSFIIHDASMDYGKCGMIPETP